MERIDPINIFTRENGKTVRHKYGYEKIHIDDQGLDDIESVNMVRASRMDHVELGECIRYQYEGKPPIYITEEYVYGREKHSITELQRQAYFALSIMDSHGNVSRWRRV